ncbi:MAG: KpsF/GutQ family sugar-phosphate isomerase [Gammaproteobacteria bacterium]|nr:KpsF/GutQ family sugar-phosphate isomerase [Gammaproteobacteria bacterium]MCP4474673.1 KpsF/GutQ family sugar-phosphate isomerase [Gammaproteobacteria bacterium]
MASHPQPALKGDDLFCQSARRVIAIEAEAVSAVAATIDGQFSAACEILLACRGRVIVIGIGKSGHIGSKLAATLASTGTPAFFVHPAEANHGDLGMITAEDVLFTISYSGNTEEILSLLPVIKRRGIKMIALTGNSNSPLAQAADLALTLSITREACPLNLAPTASTTAMLALGDALAIALLDARGFTREDFALSHPGGNLGKRLLLTVEQIMHQGAAIPVVSHQATLKEALVEMTAKRLGMTAITDAEGCVIGAFTDGDLRRALENPLDINNIAISDLMTRQCKTVKADLLAIEAFQLMEKHKILALLVVDNNNKLVGAFNTHDLFQAGVA